MAEKEKDVKLLTGKWFTTDDGIQFISLARKSPFGKADIVLVSKDGETWIAHHPDELNKAIESGDPIKVA